MRDRRTGCFPEAGRDRDDHGLLSSVRDLEFTPLAHGHLVDVSRENQVGAARDECAKNVVPAGDRLLPRAPGRTDQVVVEHDDLERAGRRFLQALLRPGQLRRADPARLVSPRAHRVEADDVQVGRGVGRLGRLPLALELPK